MKIALCLAGQPRGYKIAYDYVKKNLLDKYDVDVFIHTWANPVYSPFDVIDLYQPKCYSVETPPFDKDLINAKFTNTPDAKKWPPFATVSSYYSIFQSSLLKIGVELETKPYDYVVKSRFDYALNGVIPFQFLMPGHRMLFVPDCRMVPTKDFGNDQFAFGTSETMNDYMSTYLHMEKFYNQGVTMIGEDMLWANCKMHGLIGDNLMYVNMNNPFPPGPYNGTPHSLVRDDMDLWKGL